MQPIFKEQIKMWSDLGYSLPISEGIYWAGVAEWNYADS